MEKKANHLPKKIGRTPKIPKWYEKPISKDDFVSMTDKNGKVYGRHKEWKKTIWIGPYDTDEELSKVIASYVSVTKKPFGNRKEIKNIHSIIMNDKDW